MYTVISNKDNLQEAQSAVAALNKKYKAKSQKTAVRLVSHEQLKVWNTAASNLHATLVRVSAVAETLGLDSSELILTMANEPAIAKKLAQNLLCLTALLREQPDIVSIGYNNFQSDELKLLVMVSVNIQLTPVDYTFPSKTLLEIIRAMSVDRLELLARVAEGMTQPLNG